MRQLVNRLARRAGLGSTIARNSLFLLAGEGIARVLNLLIMVLLYRHLGPDRSGTMRFVMAYGVLFSIITEIGLTRAAIREAARAPRERLPVYAANLNLIRGGLCIVYVAVIWDSFLVPPGSSLDTQTRWLIVIWSLALVCQAARRNADVMFQATERMHFAAAFLVLNRVTATVAIVSIVIAGGGLLAVFLAYLAADLLDAVVSNIAVRRHIARPDYAPDPAGMRNLLILSVPFGLQLFAVQIYSYIDSPMLYFLYGNDRAAAEREIGWYQAAYQIVFVLQFIPLSVCSALYPALSRAFHDSRERLASLFARSYPLFVLAGFPLAAALLLLRREFVATVFGADYAPTVDTLTIVIWSIPTFFLAFPIGNLLAATDRQGWVTIMAFVQAAINVILNALFIPSMGGSGAALAQTLTMAASLLMHAAIIIIRFPDLVPWRALAVQAPIHAAAFITVWLAGGSPLAVRLALAALYALTAAAWGRALMARRPTAA